MSAPTERCCLELGDGVEEAAVPGAQHRVEANWLSVISSGNSSGELRQDLGRHQSAEMWSRLEQAGNVGEVLQALAGPAGGIGGRPDLPLEDILDGGDGKAESEELSGRGAIQKGSVPRIRLDLDAEVGT
jgi:hypothetical protein